LIDQSSSDFPVGLLNPVECSFKNERMPSSVLSPSNSIKFFLSLAGKNLIDGNP